MSVCIILQMNANLNRYICVGSSYFNCYYNISTCPDLTKIKPHINTYCTYSNISPWPAIVTEKVPPPPSEAQHVTEIECEITNINVDNYQYRTVFSISIALDFKFIVNVGWKLVVSVVQKMEMHTFAIPTSSISPIQSSLKLTYKEYYTAQAPKILRIHGHFLSCSFSVPRTVMTGPAAKPFNIRKIVSTYGSCDRGLWCLTWERNENVFLLSQDVHS